MHLRAWWFFGVVAVASLVGLIRLLIVSEPGDPEARNLMVSAGLFVVVFGTIALWMAVVRSRQRAADRSGPVAPATYELGSSRERWSLDEMAAQLARELAPMNGVVFREGRTRRLRVMLDPVTAIDVKERRRQHGEDGPPVSRWLVGSWWAVTWRKGKPPKIRARTSRVGVAGDPEAGPIPVWTPNPAEDPRFSLTPPVAPPTRPAGWTGELAISSERFLEAVDEIAVAAGWSSRNQIASAQRRVSPEGDRIVSVRREDGTTTSITIARPDGSLDSASVSSTTSTPTSNTIRTVEQRFTSTEHAAGAGHSGDTAHAERIAQLRRALDERARGQPSPPVLGTGWAGPARIMLIIGAAILAACLLATVIGLLAGMIWWASFIIVGSGLLFCLIFVLPVVLLARAGRRE